MESSPDKDEEEQFVYVDDCQYELENRIRNLLWTVGEDYELDVPIDTAIYERSSHAALYEAVKQGAFARYFDRDAYAMYLMKKLYLGGEEQSLLMLVEMCVDQAIVKKVTRDRKGIVSLRRQAFEDLLELDFDMLASSSHPLARMKIAILQEGCGNVPQIPAKLRSAMERLTAIQDMISTDEVIRRTDELYNQLIDPSFEKEHGNLEQVLRVSMGDLQKFTWQDFLNETAQEVSLEEALREMDAAPLPADMDGESERKTRAMRILITEEAEQKMHDYIELHFGRSYMEDWEQEQMNRRICRGVHGDCRLYYTDGILSNPVRENNTFVLAQKSKADNIRYYRQHQKVSRNNIARLGDILKRSLQARNEEETLAGTYGQIVPARLWKIGRTEDARLFQRVYKKENSDFVVDILMDASGSQRVRQMDVALQGYILSAALSRAGIPHRVMSFCTFWSYTVMRRFREYDDPAEADWNLMEFTSSSGNRDGLAFRASAEALLERPEANKILIVLSDGRPNDISVNRPHVKNPSLYSGEYAIKDTASEVRRLRSRDIAVLGVFAGEEQDLTAERRIFGKDFAYIRNISSFAHVVGRYLKKQLDDKE